MIPQILWTGISISYWSGLFSPIMTFEIQNQENISDTQQLSKCLFALIWLGVGEAISGLLMGTIIDCVGSKNACLANILMLIMTIIISIYQIVHDEYGIVSYISCFIWGF
jgi:fucose permease